MSNTIRVKLISDGEFKGMEELDFSTEFDGITYGQGVDITLADLIAAGASNNLAILNERDSAEGTLYFAGGGGFYGKEYEDVEG